MIYLAVILFTIFLDQYSKYLVLRYLKPIDTYPLIENVFHLTYVENRGAAFSLFTNMQPFLIFITMIFAGVLIYILIKTPKKRANLWVNLSVSCIIGGAIGNLIDRIRLNYVIDFLDFRFIKFAIFNFADVFVVCGSISFLLALFANRDILTEDPFKFLK
ncbi:MAG: signal peptidase [Eubacteriaceae bacterium]|jgi:signal peptidase II|nr:signal peptidase [Eubacteriaceae bacterium]MDK2905630.1 signal peptidase [Eubacteriaceae bacterium]MDK2936744.1 signal peptidase [Eubacteriaceae bacterium]